MGYFLQVLLFSAMPAAGNFLGGVIAEVRQVSEKMLSLALQFAAAFAVPILLGATLGYWAVRDSAEVIKFSLLAFTAGILLTVSVEEMVTEAHDKPDSTFAAVFLSFGFALFAFLAVYLEG